MYSTSKNHPESSEACCPSHWQTLTLCCIAATPTASLSPTPTFGNFWIQNVILKTWIKNKGSSVIVQMWGQEVGGGTDPLIIILPNMWSWAVRFTLRPIYRRYTLARMICGLQCQRALFAEEVIVLPQLVFEPPTSQHASQSLYWH